MGDDAGQEERTSITDADSSAMVLELQRVLGATKKELATKVKHYEGKLLTMTVINSALQSENEALKEETSSRDPGAAAAEQELKELHAEFTKRLGVAEKTASVMRDECFSLRKEVEEVRRARDGLKAQVAEKDKGLEQYRSEGEVLARRAGEAESLVKKLRSDSSRLEQDKERLHSRVQLLEAAAASVDANRNSSLEDAHHALAIARQALVEQKALLHHAVEEAERKGEREVAAVREEWARQDALAAQRAAEQEHHMAINMDALRQRVSAVNEEASAAEDRLREEIHRLEARIRAAEVGCEETAARATEASLPLLRQIEGMAAHIDRLEASAARAQHERELSATQTEATLQLAEDRWRKAESAKESAERRAGVADRAVAEARRELEEARQQWDQRDEERRVEAAEAVSAREQASAAEQSHASLMQALASVKHHKEAAERALQVALLERSSEAEEQRRQIDALKKIVEKLSVSKASGSAPTAPTGPSAADGNGSWLEEELEGRGRGRGRSSPSGPESKSGQMALEAALAKIRQQTGVMSQLQSQLALAKDAQEQAGEEVLRVSHQLTQLQQGSASAKAVAAELEELRRRHEVALVIIGERNEKAEELEADMADVKALYREQINLLVSEVDPEKWPQGYRICLFCSHCSQVQRSNKRGGER